MSNYRNELKGFFTEYWKYMAVHTACKLNIFDLIKSGMNTIDELSNSGNFDRHVLSDLISALEQLNILDINNNHITLTSKGDILTEDNESSLKYACIHWGTEHLTAWQNLEYTLKNGKSAFENIYKKTFFDYLSEDETKTENYHKAMHEYARDDYNDIYNKIDFSVYDTVMDIGGGFGALINNIANNNPNIKCYLFDKPEVVKFLTKKPFEIIGGDFFNEIPAIAETFILSRVIHDWDDKNAIQILKNVYKALPTHGTLYIIENLTDKINNKASLLSLNMHIITKGHERTEAQYIDLIQKTGFIVNDIIKINELQFAIKTIKA